MSGQVEFDVNLGNIVLYGARIADFGLFQRTGGGGNRIPFPPGRESAFMSQNRGFCGIKAVFE
jgi:hypothetical protein